MLLSGDTRSANRVIGARELFEYFQAWLAPMLCPCENYRSRVTPIASGRM